MVGPYKLKEFFEKNPSKIELFMDDDGVMYAVDKGDLDLYWLRRGGEEIKENTSGGFLEDIKLDLF